MLDPYESLSSTGEPPTVSQESSSMNSVYSPQVTCSGDSHTETSHREGPISPLSSGTRSRTLSAQEPDSGYEASPSSIADNQRFFGEQAVAVANRMDVLQACSSLYPDDEFDFVECHSQTLFYESESDLEDYDTCQDCCSPFLACSCCRTDSSSTNATAISNCDTSRCNSSDLAHRPSSQPIQVPTQQSCRISPEIRSRLEHSLSSLLDMYPEPRSLPMNLGHLHTLGLIPENYPLSWPSVPHSALNSRRRVIALPSPRTHHISLNVDIPNRCRRFNHPRNRRQIIDSEASSFCSSDDEGPEDVFNMSGEEPSSFLMTATGSVPLPDIVLESTDSGRRGRSVSVNLPLERRLEVIRDVGQSLRRMSDLFDQRRELCIAVMRLRNRRASDGFDRSS